MDDFFTPEVVGGLTGGLAGGLMVLAGLLFTRGLGWLRDVITRTPTKIDDKLYNAARKAFVDAGPIPLPAVDEERREVEGDTVTSLRAPAIAVALAILLTLPLTACEIPGMIGNPIQSGAQAPAGQEGTEGKEKAADDEAWLDALADEIVNADTAAGRALRVCLLGAVAAELQTYRVLYYSEGRDPVLAAVGGIARMRSAVARIRAQADSLWFETEMFYASADIVRAVEGPLRDRARSAVRRALTLDWRGIARGLRQAGGQTLLASAMFRDARRAADLLKQGRLQPEEAWQSCQGRIAQNEAALNGALGIDPPPRLLEASPAS